MKILVYPHELKIGGSAINAIDLAAAVRDLGHEVLVFSGGVGPLTELISARGIRLINVPTPARPRPSPQAMRLLWRIVQEEHVDLVHTYEHYPCLEAFYAAHILRGRPMVATIMSMEVTRDIPRHIPLTVGTRHLQQNTRRAGPIILLEPPIDIDHDTPGFDASDFRARHRLDGDTLNVVMVSRFVRDLKLEGLSRAIDAVAMLAAEVPVRLVMVGDGPMYPDIQRQAESANSRLGRQAIVLTGQMLDPRPAYAAADVVIGMGSSILRGMAFRKPVVVVGEKGFSEIVTPITVHRFLFDGFYGVGAGDLMPHRLADQLRLLLQRQNLRQELGYFSRALVAERFSLKMAARSLDHLYRSTVGQRRSWPRLAAEGARTAGTVLLFAKLQPRVTGDLSPSFARLFRRRTKPLSTSGDHAS